MTLREIDTGRIGFGKRESRHGDLHGMQPIARGELDHLANKDFEPAALMNKNLGLAMDAAKSTGLAAPQGSHAAKICAKYAADHGEKDFSAVTGMLRGNPLSTERHATARAVPGRGRHYRLEPHVLLVVTELDLLAVERAGA